MCDDLRSDHLMVVAIDFGTTYSGYAFSLGSEFESEPTKISSNSPWVASQGLVSHKAPTCVLLHPDQSFYMFGYEAEDRYNELALDDTVDHTQYYYFRRFKMILHRSKNLRRETVIEDMTGKAMQARKIFVYGIEYLMQHALATINKQGKTLDAMDIHWVLTVPAIWSDNAKQFMREAAQKAGIESNQLSIALEPEAASVYCKFLPNHLLKGFDTEGSDTKGSSTKGSNRHGSFFKQHSKYMVIDLGGGTADITVHKTEADNTLCELHAPSGGAWGGTKVDDAFVKFLEEIFTEDIVRVFMRDHLEDAIDLFREFEIRKRKVKVDMSSTPTMAIKIPVALYELYNEEKGKSLKSAMADNAKYCKTVTCFADKMKIDSKIMQSFFKRPLEDLVEHIREILAEHPVRGVDTFILVGGFSESDMVQETIRRKFPNMKTIVPFDAGLAVLKGAVIFGHSPLVVTSRVCRHTYGMAVSKSFVEGKDPDCKKYYAGGRALCKDVFHRYMELGQSVRVGQAITTVPLSTAGRHHRRATVRVYSSQRKCPGFVTEDGCEYLGEIVVSLPDTDSDQGGTVEVHMTFGGTELAVEAIEKTTGQVYKSRFDFLSEK